MPIIKNEPTDEKLDVESSGSALDGVAGVPIIPMDLEVSAVPRSSSSTLGGCSCAAEALVPHSSLHPADQGFVQKLGATDYVTLYYTLVADKVLPHGFLGDLLPQFGTTRSTIVGQELEGCHINIRLTRRDVPGDAKEKSLDNVPQTASATDQLLVAADIRPRRFRSKWQQACFECPTARKDAEAAERSRWISLLADLLRNTTTPMGRLLRENPANSQLLGGGRRAGTLRSRVRALQKFLSWLALAHNLTFPVKWRQLVDHMQVRLSVRGSLKLIHLSYIYARGRRHR